MNAVELEEAVASGRILLRDISREIDIESLREIRRLARAGRVHDRAWRLCSIRRCWFIESIASHADLMTAGSVSEADLAKPTARMGDHLWLTRKCLDFFPMNL